MVRQSPHKSPVTAENACHVSVLLEEVLEFLAPRPGGRYLDGTLGLAGHSSAIMERTEGAAFLCGLDRDPQALERASVRLAPYKEHCRLFSLEYASFGEALDCLGWNTVDGALLDIGVSSLQLDVTERGFSLHADAPLDMRMDMGSLASSTKKPWAESARTVVNMADIHTLRQIIETFGEDPMAPRIAKAIVEARQKAPIETTGQLADIVWHTYPSKWRNESRNHPATRTFQAIRMVVNDELGQLERFLNTILPRLSIGGRLAIITFHSLEDRIVKQKFRQWSTDCICPPHLPRCTCGHHAEALLLTKKPVVPGRKELFANSRSGSAKLRVVEKLPPFLKELS